MSLDEEAIESLNEAMNRRYDARVSEAGFGAYALGWGERRYQLKRFETVLHALDPARDIAGKSVLDVGAGLGDFLDYCVESGFNPASFYGIDINPQFVKEAQRRHPEATFAVRDLLLNVPDSPLAETGVVIGVLNLRHEAHIEYTRRLLRAAWTAVSKTLLVNVISDVHNDDYPREEFIHYHEPAETLKMALELTPFCSIIHDFGGEPQWEFNLVMRKQPWSKE